MKIIIMMSSITDYETIAEDMLSIIQKAKSTCLAENREMTENDLGPLTPHLIMLLTKLRGGDPINVINEMDEAQNAVKLLKPYKS